jgi:hypothetical protein
MVWTTTIQWHDEEEPIEGYLMTDEDPSDNDEDIFFYVKGENELKSMLNQKGVEFTLLSYEVAK